MEKTKALTFWDLILSLYFTHHKLNPAIVNLVAVEPIIKCCVMGDCNFKIARAYKISQKEVEKILVSYINFFGWEYDLDFNPLALYKRVEGDFLKYCEEINLISAVTKSKIIYMSFNICRHYFMLRKVIDKHYVR
jgi:hypothetical protein